MKKIQLCKISEFPDRVPQYQQVNGLDLVVIRYGKKVSVLYGRCLHRGALMADGYVEGNNLICGLHGWDYRFDTGISEYNNEEALHKFWSEIEEGVVFINEEEINEYLKDHPQPFKTKQYLGQYADTHPESTEPYTGYIKELAGTGICSGEGGMLPEEQANNSRYFYELASGKFGFSWDKVKKVQAFHFKAGQGAKTGTGGHLPGHKVTSEIASVRGLKEGQAAISPATFPQLKTVEDFRQMADEVRKRTGGIPVGFKLAAGHIEADIDFALEVGVDYLILDGRGGGTGAAPTILRDNINVPTIPALARARRHLDLRGAKDVTLIITGGLRVAEDFAKALMLGADAIAVSNAALQAIGCLGMRACHTNNCPVGIATQRDDLRSRLIIDASAQQLYNFFSASTQLIQVIARACGYNDVEKFKVHDLSTTDFDMYRLTGIRFAGIQFG